jgi:uncharacterized protein (DUF1499 family)
VNRHLRAVAVLALVALLPLPLAATVPPADRLAPCPGTPNCVSTTTADASKRMAPWPFTGPADAVPARLVAIVRAEPRTAIVQQADGYVRATFTSRLFRFVDDVEFVVDPAARLVHFRSASRIGESDLGVNRRRMERLARAFTAGGTR